MKKIIFLAILSTLLLQGCKTAGQTEAKAAKPIEMNPEVLITSKNPGMGNCLACHAIPSRPELAAGTIAPPLVNMKERFPDIAKLRAEIYDQKVFNPQTMMPPFGRNKIMTPEQIDVIAQYIYKF
jgi:sulfur oxidation c-type cytochrome SoxX